MIVNPGETFGSYRIVRQLGRGGMSEVYEAVAPDGKAVAVKVFAVRWADADFLRKRFLAEGRILSCLDHPNLVHVYEVGVDSESETPYLVMELVLSADGSARTLADVQKAGEVTAELAERWYGQLCAALRACHTRGIVHRDVKLNNVLVDTKGNAILSDFGVSRVFDPELRDELQVTTTFVEGETAGTRPVMGTFWYLAPEVRQVGETVTNAPGLSKNDLRRENVKIGWFGQGGRGSNMGRYFDGRHLPPSIVTNVWPEFPPRRIDSKDANWVREASQIASVPVGLKPANKLGLHDMIGNCFEMTADCGVFNTNRWGGERVWSAGRQSV